MTTEADPITPPRPDHQEHLWGCLSAEETGEPHGHRPITAEATATTATEATAATASGRGLKPRRA
jgi:hypothetical protein